MAEGAEAGGDGEEKRPPPRGLASAQPPSRSPSRYTLFVGLAFIVLVVVAFVNAAGNDQGGPLGTDPAESGRALPEFAVPAVIGGPPGDANVFQDDCSSSRNPCPEDERRASACELDLEGVLRVCDYFDRPLVLSFWFTRFADCLPLQDELDQLSRRYRGRVNFLSIDVRDEIEKVRSIVAEHGWQMPVGYDADGAVSNLYRVGGCPTVLLAYPGGIMAKALIGTEATGASLTDEIDAVLAESRRRASEDR